MADDNQNDDKAFLTFSMAIRQFASTTGTMCGATKDEIANGLLHALALYLAQQNPGNVQTSASQFSEALVTLTEKYAAAMT